MADIDFIELATHCQDKYKEKYTPDKGWYIDTKFVAITKEGEVITSATPHALGMAEQCILLHFGKEITSSGSYFRGLSQFINKNGVVSNYWLDNRFKLILDYNYPQGYTIQLEYEYDGHATCLLTPEPWEKSIGKMWKLYSRLKDLDSFAKIKLVTDLFQKDEQILDLEKQIEDFKFMNYLLELERNQYKSLLDEIKENLTKK